MPEPSCSTASANERYAPQHSVSRLFRLTGRYKSTLAYSMPSKQLRMRSRGKFSKHDRTGPSVKLTRPLDHHALSQIPIIGERVQILGPYTFEELLQEPDHEQEVVVDYRNIQIEESKGASINVASIEVTRKKSSKKISISLEGIGKTTIESRYLFRKSWGLPIEGVVTLHATYLLYGALDGYTATCEKVIHVVYVTPASQRRGIARILLAEVLTDAPDVKISPHFSADGARLFGFDTHRKTCIAQRSR
jgi:ribosomal protein S18 acetylase RimI-like enzyme